MRRLVNRLCITAVVVHGCLSFGAYQVAAENPNAESRERAKFDFGWRFAFGHASDRSRDFDPGNSAFSYLAKTGFATGAAAPDFDDRAWRELDLPHDWAVESPFDPRASNSHGSKAIGRNFPERSVGWYRKNFFVPATDVGKRISLEFDGVFRDSQVWVNGHYLGREESGYDSFAYNISEFLNYGGKNVVAVRVDATLEEGWFYEGAGIYRHVWLVKTAPIHVERHGTFVTAEVSDGSALVTIRAKVGNDGLEPAEFHVAHTVVDADGTTVASAEAVACQLLPGAGNEYTSTVHIDKPLLWSLESPHLYRLQTNLRVGDLVIDSYETPFGIRTIKFDPDEGFYLNGKHFRLYGTNNHQDHAGVGVAIPDALQEFRIARLKEVGCNAYRCAHNPPTPELLEACDRLGMLVVDENRAMGTSATQLGQLERLIRRDRNHPCVILWSIGNEEWGIEGNEQGERIAAKMQSLVQQLDPTRRVTVASSGNWGKGVSVPIDVMGFNYYTHGDTDDFHKQFPGKPSIGTEECSTFSTRGVYDEGRDRQHLTAYDENCPDWGALANDGWGHFADRKYLAGLFIWIGFDYRGEPTPFHWPAISSQFGILDTCGFRKDNSYYYEAWWTDKPLVHLLPHWNWPGKEGQPIRVWAHSNCDEVELLLNDKSLGRQQVKRNSHLEWEVPYAPGTLVARGLRHGELAANGQIETTGPPVAVQLTSHRSALRADGQDVAVVTVQVVDAEGRQIATASQEIEFALTGAGAICGVGNGDPSSHESDQFLDAWSTVDVQWNYKSTIAVDQPLVVGAGYDDSDWGAFASESNPVTSGDEHRDSKENITVYRGTFERPQLADSAEVSVLVRGHSQAPVYLNGEPCAMERRRGSDERVATLDNASLREGKNVIAIISDGASLHRDHLEREAPAVLKVRAPVERWKRKLFNGLAQVIVRSTAESGQLTLIATAPGLEQATLTLETSP
jgi:beta-galactosidase